MGKQDITLPNNWKPRRYQLALWEALGKFKRVCVRWHRRSGKDDVMLHDNACKAFERVGNYWYMLPEYSQCRKAIWDAINPHTGIKRVDEAFPQTIRKNTLNQEMKIEFVNGSTWQLMGSDNFDSLVGSPPVGLTFSEYALSNPSSWGFLRPILLENGGWAAFNSTPRGKNHFKNLCDLAQRSPDWFYQELTVDDTGIFTREQLDNELMELQSEHGDVYGMALYLQEYYVSFDAAIPGAIWGESCTKVELDGRLGDFPHIPGIKVHTSWDIGRSDMTAVWFYQMVNGRIRVVDYFEDNFREIPDLCAVLEGKKESGYEYGVNWLPHDAKPLKLGMGGKTILQQFLGESVRCGIGDFTIAPNIGREDGIQAARATFPLCDFNKDTTEDGFEHLKNYKRAYDEVKKTFSNVPVHDIHSHSSDSFRYLSLTWRQSKAAYPEMTFAERIMQGNVVGINFGQLKQQHFNQKRRERMDLS